MTDELQPEPEQTRRDEITHIARELFIRQGYHGTSMRQIAQQSHLALGGLYNHFANKEDVFRAVFFDYHPYHDVLPHLLVAGDLSVEDYIKTAFTLMVKAMEKRPHFIYLLFIELVEFKSVHLNELFQNLFPQIMQIVEHVMSQGEGKIRPLPPVIFARIFLGILFGYYISDFVIGQNLPSELSAGALDYFIDVYLHGMMKTP